MSMAEVVLFPHAQGLTDGLRSFARRLEGAGHVVHLVDLYEGRTFDTLEAGIDHAQSIGFEALLDRGVAAAEGLPAPLVYLGFSLGVMPAQKLAETRPGAAGAVLLHACVPVEEFAPRWPADVPVHVHGMDRDPFFADEGDLDAARALVSGLPDGQGELFVYPGSGHLFTDDSLPDFDAEAAQQVTRRVLDLLAGV
jgi:dienelactone hydrolase